MADFTPTLKLIKPAPTDTFDVGIINANFDRIDAGSLINENSVARVRDDVTAINGPWEVDTGAVGRGAYSATVSARYKKVGSTVYAKLNASWGSTTKAIDSWRDPFCISVWDKYIPNLDPHPSLNVTYGTELVGVCSISCSNGYTVNGFTKYVVPGFGATGFAFVMHFSSTVSGLFPWPSVPFATNGQDIPNMPDPVLSALVKYRVG